MFQFETRLVSKRFRRRNMAEVRALDEVSIQASAGGFIALSGASGSGKTTLLSLLGALDRPTSGEILFNAKPLAGCSDVELTRVRRSFGFVFQNFSLIPGLSVWQNVAYPLIPRGVPAAERRSAAHAMLERLGVLPQAFKRPTELSGGEQQRVALARALACDPDVVLADEPTSNLDPRASEQVRSMLKQLQQEGKTIIVSTHDRDLLALATQIHRLDQGRLLPSEPS